MFYNCSLLLFIPDLPEFNKKKRNSLSSNSSDSSENLTKSDEEIEINNNDNASNHFK